MADKSAQESSAALNLLSRLKKGTTGRLSVGNGSARVTVYVMNGAVLAAEAADDIRLLLRRLSATPDLARERAQELRALNDLGEPVFGLLLDEIPSEQLEAALHDRFRDNVARFLGSGEKPSFNQMKSIFVENIQLGLEVERLVAECGLVADDAASVDLDAEFEPGDADPACDLERELLGRLGSQGGLARALSELPVEPIAGRASIARMVRQGVIRIRGLDAPDQAPAGSTTEDPPFEADPTEETPATPDVAEQPPEHDVLPVDFEDDGAIDPPTEEQGSADDGTGDLSSLDAWSNHGVEIEDDLMEAFADHDYDRGSAAQGAGEGTDGLFKTDAEHLDRVEVQEPAAPEPAEEVLEADEAPQAKFSAPVLSEEDALTKLDVANECLRAMAGALDAVEGAGAGRAAVQLLVDGIPAKFQALLAGVQVTDSGELPADDVLDNLAERPSSEHRALLNQGLMDLIERGLSAVGDELPDELFDTMYEQVSGYRQRLGL